MICLSVTGLSKQFAGRNGRIQAVDQVDFSLEQGRTLGIIGESGCGKTTLVRMVLGLLRPDNGLVHCSGRIGFVGQDPYASLCPALTVEQLVAEPLVANRLARSTRACRPAVRQALAFASLEWEAYGRRYPTQLSGGERQRVCIARALILKPHLLVLDEPTSMLDQEVKEGIAQILRRAIQKEGAACLLVTHDVGLAASLCDDIAVMQNGRFVERGRAKEILARPQAELTRTLLQVEGDLRGYWREQYGIIR